MGNEKEALGTCPGCLWPGEMSSPALLACCREHSSCRHRLRLGILSPKHFVFLRERALCLQRDLYQDFPWMPSAGMRWCSGSAEATGGLSGGGSWGLRDTAGAFGRAGSVLPQVLKAHQQAKAQRSPQEGTHWPSQFQSSLNDLTITIELLRS